MKLATNKGFTLIEVCLVLGLTGLVIGGMVSLLGSFSQEFAPKSIEHKGKTYEVAPSLKASMEAFEFHQVFIKYLDGAQMGICFGGTAVENFQRHAFFPLKDECILATWLQEKVLKNGRIRSTHELVSHIKRGTARIALLFEKMATDSDLTCILLGKSKETSSWVQVRKEHFQLDVDSYNIYRIVLFSFESKQAKAEYRFAVKSEEDPYARTKSLERVFLGKENPREVFFQVVLPDPFMVSGDNGEGLKSHSRFSYTIDAF